VKKGVGNFRSGYLISCVIIWQQSQFHGREGRISFRNYWKYWGEGSSERTTRGRFL